jgi:hypothetical protein
MTGFFTRAILAVRSSPSRAGDERLAASTLEDEDAHRIVAVDLLADLVQTLVHLPGHRVARLGPVERQRDDRAVALDDDVLARLRRLLHGLGPRCSRRS